MRTGIILQSRMDSTRLPNKALRMISGKTLFQRCLENLVLSAGHSYIPILATTERTIDLPLVHAAQAFGVNVFRGSTLDVLKRFYDASNFYKLDVIARQTGDNPFLSPKLQLQALDHANTLGEAPFILTSRDSGLPKGLDLEVFNHEALVIANSQAQSPYDREHVTPFMQKSDLICNRKIVTTTGKFPFKVYTVDTPEDLETATKIAEAKVKLPKMQISF